MARQITRQLAQAIVKKLKAQKAPGTTKAHDTCIVEHNGQIVGHISLRRGSNKEQGHDHIPRDINVPSNFAKQLAYCPKSRNDWLDELRRQNLIS